MALAKYSLGSNFFNQLICGECKLATGRLGWWCIGIQGMYYFGKNVWEKQTKLRQKSILFRFSCQEPIQLAFYCSFHGGGKDGLNWVLIQLKLERQLSKILQQGSKLTLFISVEKAGNVSPAAICSAWSLPREKSKLVPLWLSRQAF